MSKNQWGLALGLFFAIVHIIWSLAVWLIPDTLQQFINWVFVLHHIVPLYVITAFNWVNALILIVVTFIVGYVFGLVLATAIRMVKR